MKGDEAEDLMKYRRGSRRTRSQGGMKEQAGGRGGGWWGSGLRSRSRSVRERHAGRQQCISYCVAGRQALAGRELRLGACSPASGAQRGQLVLGSTLLSQVPGHDVLARNTRGTGGDECGLAKKKKKSSQGHFACGCEGLAAGVQGHASLTCQGRTLEPEHWCSVEAQAASQVMEVLTSIQGKRSSASSLIFSS